MATVLQRILKILSTTHVFVKFCTSAVKEGLGTIAHIGAEVWEYEGRMPSSHYLDDTWGGGDVFDKPSLSLM